MDRQLRQAGEVGYSKTYTGMDCDAARAEASRTVRDMELRGMNRPQVGLAGLVDGGGLRGPGEVDRMLQEVIRVLTKVEDRTAELNSRLMAVMAPGEPVGAQPVPAKPWPSAGTLVGRELLSIAARMDEVSERLGGMIASVDI